MLASGELDRALTAFEIATGQAAMGYEVNFWFTFYGVNAIMKPRSLFAARRWRPAPDLKGVGRRMSTDTILQRVVRILNHHGAKNLPSPRLNFLGLGPKLVRLILRSKGMASLEDLIDFAVQLGVHFKVCQICVDALALNVAEDLVVEAEILGVSSDTLDTMRSHYNVVI